ncbi:unnamed protein product [Penicillium pancosmium]
MNDIMEQCESGKFALEDLGLTLSPGSQSQSFAHTMDFSEFDLSMDLDFGLMDNFDPLTDFDPIVHQIDIPTLAPTPAKRSLEDVSPNEAETPPKRSCQSVPSPSLESLAMQTQSRMDLANRASPMVSTNDLSTAGSSNPASAAAMTRFGLDPHETADAIPTVQRTVPFLSPYQVSKYYPSAPSLHTRTVNVEVSSSALQHRLKNSQRRINVLVIERNRYRDKLLSYTQPDPRTGKLKIDEMEAEITTLRRVTSTQQTRTRNLKAELQSCQNEYANLARTHNSLLADYRASQKSPTLPSRQSPETTSWGGSEPWKGAYDQLLAEHRSLISALKTPGVDPTQLLEGLGMQSNNKASSANYPSPASISSMPNRTPAVPHQDSVVIDLTDDGAEDVSTLGFPTVQLGPPANEPQLTDFRHVLRHKKLDWIRPPLNVRMAAQALFDNISPVQGSSSALVSKQPKGLLAPPPEPSTKKKENDENAAFISSDVVRMQSYEHTNLPIRRIRETPSSSTATNTPSSRTSAPNVQVNTRVLTSISSFNSLFDEEPEPTAVPSVQEHKSLADSCFDYDCSLFVEQLVGQSDEHHSENGEDYHPDDDELARMLEEELAR